MSGVSGGFEQLEQYRQRLLKMAGAPQRAAKAVAPLFEASSKATFGAAADLYGNPWKADKPATYRLGTKSPMYRSGALFAALSASALESKIKMVWDGVAYLRFQLSKGKRSPLPYRGSLPPDWVATIKTQVQEALNAIAGGH